MRRERNSALKNERSFLCYFKNTRFSVQIYAILKIGMFLERRILYDFNAISGCMDQ